MVEPVCACGELDTPWHRVWRCPVSEPARAGRAAELLTREAVAAGPSSPLFGRLWMPRPLVTSRPRELEES
eukprot:4948461-Lingulodinium_polyedra.AAC.1